MEGQKMLETRTQIRQIVDSERFNNIVFIAILASSISIGFETYDWGATGNRFLLYLDWFFTVSYTHLTLPTTPYV